MGFFVSINVFFKYCEVEYFTHFAAFFMVARTKRFVAKSWFVYSYKKMVDKIGQNKTDGGLSTACVKGKQNELW